MAYQCFGCTQVLRTMKCDAWPSLGLSRPMARSSDVNLCCVSRGAGAQRLMSVGTGREHLTLRILLVCGLRPQELLALRDDGVTAGALRIDEAIKEKEKGQKPLVKRNRRHAQAHLRHSELAMTGLYMKEIPEQIKAAVESLDASLCPDDADRPVN